MESSFRNITSKLEKQYEQKTKNSDNVQRSIGDTDHRWDMSGVKLEARNVANDSTEKQHETGAHYKLVFFTEICYTVILFRITRK